MKHIRTLLILSVLTVLIGAFAYVSLSQTPLVPDQVKIEPKPFDLENPDGVTVTVKLSRDGKPVVDQIDPLSVSLEGLSPINTWVTKAPPDFVALFDGSEVAQMVISIIEHMQITSPNPWVPIKITLKIAGTLYDGTQWEGYGEIKVYIPDPSAPPPPPPP